MKFQIREIVLWPKKAGIAPRRVEFKPGMVNVITGASRTGKSAIIPIIDYCLGSENCAIPVMTIRDACEWFGVLVDVDGGQKLFARREPGKQKSTGDMFVLEAPTVSVPKEILGPNSNVDRVKRTLDELAGLTNLDFNPSSSESGFLGRPSFRDLGSFIYQPQNVVANHDVLFYKADSFDHRQKLVTIFPYVLNAITPELMAKQHELEQLRRDLKRRRNELATARQVSENWIANIRAKVSEARELGLIAEPIPATVSKDRMVEMLAKVVDASGRPSQKVTSETVDEAVNELVQLQREESDISLSLSGLRRRLGEMSALKEASKRYEGGLQVQRDRLKVAELLTEHRDDCPICGHGLEKAAAKVAELQQSLKAIERTAGEFGVVPVAFDRELERVKDEIRVTTEKLAGVNLRRRDIEQRSQKAKQSYYDSLQASRFIGSLEQSLQLYSTIGKDSDLENTVKTLEERVLVLEKEISEGAIKAKTKRALDAINLNAGKLLPSLDNERPNDPISLSIQDLSIKVKGVDREDYLWEIGSGSNWLSYHIAVSLGLHQFFLSQKQSPIPGFIVYDQPSQVYFPKKMATRSTDKEDLDPKLKDEDLDAVQKVFKLMASVVKASGERLQVIVLDHAAENVWGSIAGVNPVEEWRGGKKLVPPAWLV